MSGELISVIIPTYNRAALIKDAIESIRRQNYRPCEIIVVDDNSTDNIREVLDSLLDVNLKYIRHSSNKGIPATRNTGLYAAEGKYIAFLDSDDLWYGEKLTRQIAVFRERGEAGFIFTNGYYKKEGELLFRTERQSGFLSQENNHFPMKDVTALPSSWLFKREVVEGIGGFDTKMAAWEDGDFFVRAARRYKVYFLNEPLVFWRSPQENFNQQEELRNREIFLQKHRGEMMLDGDYYFRFLITTGKDYLRIGDRQKAGNFFQNAIKARPFAAAGWRNLLKTVSL